MGTHHNGDNLPPDGDRSPNDRPHVPELPALPEGVVIPDDPSALAAEAARVRAELRGDTPPTAGNDAPFRRPRQASAAAPLVVMSIAVAITLVSLFAMAWAGSTTARRVEATTTPLPSNVVLTDHAGQPRDIASLAPMVIVLTEQCQTCDDLVDDTAAQAPAGVTVVRVDSELSPQPAEASNVVHLADPQGELREALELRAPPAGAATVVLANEDHVVRKVPSTNTVESYSDILGRLSP